MNRSHPGRYDRFDWYLQGGQAIRRCHHQDRMGRLSHHYLHPNLHSSKFEDIGRSRREDHHHHRRHRNCWQSITI